MLNSSVLDILNKHCSIRKFKDEKIDFEIKEKLEESFILSPTSQGLQSCSLLEITDEKIKERLSVICGQDYIKDSTLMYIFVADFYKNMQIKDKNLKSLGINHLLQGYTDAIISAQSVYLTAESLGIYGFYCGSISKGIGEIIDLLKLPKFTYPVIALCLGYPEQDFSKKPRLDKKYRIFKDEYVIYDNYDKEFEKYDEELNTYIDFRNPNKTIGKFTDIIRNNYSLLKMNYEVIRQQGFEL